jgi:hypothetical protein
MSSNLTFQLSLSSPPKITDMELKTTLIMESMLLSFTIRKLRSPIFLKSLLPQSLPQLHLPLLLKIKNALLTASSLLVSAFLFSEVIYLLQDLDKNN